MEEDQLEAKMEEEDVGNDEGAQPWGGGQEGMTISSSADGHTERASF